MKFFFALFLVAAPAFAVADPVEGVWKTQPDRKDLVSHIQVSQCGTKICGTVLKAFDLSGKEVKTSKIGKHLFRDMEAAGGEKYGNGVVQVASLNMKARATMELNGNNLRVTGCKGPACYGQTWSRLK